MRKDLPESIANLDLNKHPLHDVVATIIRLDNAVTLSDVQSPDIHKAENYCSHIYHEFFENKESVRVFYLTIARLLALANREVEKKFGVDIPHAEIPKGKIC